jgi:hypothetical protein
MIFLHVKQSYPPSSFLLPCKHGPCSIPSNHTNKSDAPLLMLWGLAGAHVTLVEKQGSLGGNSAKATSGKQQQ